MNSFKIILHTDSQALVDQFNATTIGKILEEFQGEKLSKEMRDAYMEDFVYMAHPCSSITEHWVSPYALYTAAIVSLIICTSKALKTGYCKTSILTPWRSIFQPFSYSGGQIEVAFHSNKGGVQLEVLWYSKTEFLKTNRVVFLKHSFILTFANMTLCYL